MHHVNFFCSLVTEDCNIFHSQSTVKTLESASQLPYRHTLKRFVVLLSKGAKGPVDLCSARTEVERRLVDSRKVNVDFSLVDMDLSEFKGR